jgi:hypothetical protein
MKQQIHAIALALLTFASLATPLPPCINQGTITSPAAPPETANMTAPTTKNTLSASSSKHETAKQWLQRCLRKQPSVQANKDAGDGGLRDRLYVQRPRTAPSTGKVTETSAESVTPAIPTAPVDIPLPVHTPSIQPPSRPTRPDSGVMRDVNAWLDASMSEPSPPLMAGLTYWRTTTGPNAKDSASMQHAIPIVRKQHISRPSTSHGQPNRPARRRAKKIGVQVPYLARNKSNRDATRKIVNRRSNSVPVLALPYESTQPGAPPALLTRSRSFLSAAARDAAHPETKHNSGHSYDAPLVEQSHSRYGSPASTSLRTSEGTNSIEQRVHAFFVRSSRSGDSTRSSGAAARITRENSMGDMSEAPTYSSGPLPPSYRSRTASILTTSSFGCIDGMNAEQRQISQQRAAFQRTMKGKLKRIAQNFTA